MVSKILVKEEKKKNFFDKLTKWHISAKKEMVLSLCTIMVAQVDVLVAGVGPWS